MGYVSAINENANVTLQAAFFINQFLAQGWVLGYDLAHQPAHCSIFRQRNFHLPPTDCRSQCRIKVDDHPLTGKLQIAHQRHHHRKNNHQADDDENNLLGAQVSLFGSGELFFLGHKFSFL
jgi:hypothetical protein